MAGMNTDDLAAIRARDAADANITSREAVDNWFVQLRIDVRTLLAEVDRLTAEMERLTSGPMPDGLRPFVEAAVWAHGKEFVYAERARIRALVEGLPDAVHLHDVELGPHLHRDAVIAAIDGGEK